MLHPVAGFIHDLAELQGNWFQRRSDLAINCNWELGQQAILCRIGLERMRPAGWSRRHFVCWENNGTLNDLPVAVGSIGNIRCSDNASWCDNKHGMSFV